MNHSTYTNRLDQFFAYFFAPEYDRPAPAIYVRDPNKPGFARLYLANYAKKKRDMEEAIEIAKQDLAAAIRATQPLCGQVSKPTHLQSILYEEGYDWPWHTPVEIEVPEDVLED
jgi:hypothetical protein